MRLVQGLYIITISTFPVATDNDSTGATEHQKTLSYSQYWSQLLNTPGVPLFLLLLLVMGTCKSVIDIFLFLHLQVDLGTFTLFVLCRVFLHPCLVAWFSFSPVASLCFLVVHCSKYNLLQPSLCCLSLAAL